MPHISKSFPVIAIYLALVFAITGIGDPLHASDEVAQQTRLAFLQRCQKEAVESISTHVRAESIYLMPYQQKRGTYYVMGLNIYKYAFGYPLSNTHPHWLFFQVPGLTELEYDLPESRLEVFGERYGTFDFKTRIEGNRHNVLKSRYALKVTSITRPDDESKRIIGREIKVIDLKTNSDLAIKREFFWIDPDPRRAGVVYDWCPKKENEGSSVGVFLKKVFSDASTTNIHWFSAFCSPSLPISLSCSSKTGHAQRALQ